MEFPQSRRGGARRGNGVARRTEPTVRIYNYMVAEFRARALEGTKGALGLTGSKTSPVSGVGPSVALSSSIVAGVAKSGALFTRVTTELCTHTCTYRMRNFIMCTRLQLRAAWAVCV